MKETLSPVQGPTCSSLPAPWLAVVLALFCCAARAQTASTSRPPSPVSGAVSAGVPGQAADGTTDDSAALSSACVSGRSLYLTSAASYLLAVNTTLGCSLHMNGARFRVGSGATLTINGGFEAGSLQAFELQGTGRVVFGGATTEVPVEWFGATGGDASSRTGTDNTAAIQAAINSLQSGHVDLASKFYRVSAALSITKGNVGIRGTDAGYSGLASPAPVSVILSTSSSADIVDVSGTASAPSAWNDFRFFSLMRSVTPTGTATGLSFNYVGGYSVDHVQSQDSIRDFYFHFAPNFGVGSVQNTSAGWGGAGVTGYAGRSTYGFYLDSTDGTAENSIVFNNVATSCNTSNACGTNYAMYIYGSAINDVDVDFLGVANPTYGIYIKDTGAETHSALPAYDLHFHNVTIDTFSAAGIYISGVAASLMGGITFTDGYVENLDRTGGRALDIEESSGITVANMQIDNRYGDGVYANGSSNLAILGNLFSQTTGSFIALHNTSDSTIQGNVLRGDRSYATSTMIALAGSRNNSVTGNALGGWGATGMSFDAASTGTQQGGNAVDPTHITTPVSDPAAATSLLAVRLGAGVSAATEAVDASNAVKARGSIQAVASDGNSAVLDEPETNDSRVLAVGSDAGHTGGVTLAGISAGSSHYQAYLHCSFSATCVMTNPIVLPLYTPASSSAPCTPGQIADDASYHYVCVAPNTWKRAALSVF